MGFDDAGTFEVTTPGQPVSPHTTISSTVFNALIQDIAGGLSTAICRDGQSTVSANIPMNNKKLTGLAPGTARTDSATLANIQDSAGIYVATVGGTADVITLTPSPAITAYAAGQTFRFIASGANTTNVTVAISSLPAEAITKNGATALVAGDIPSGAMVTITYDGTSFQLVGNVAFVGGAVTSSPYTMSTARLLGRTTASTGAIEEISAGTGLTLSGGSISSTAASTSAAGVAELATQAEVNAMTDTSRIVTPNHNKIVQGTLVASTSGTSIDFTGIPAGVRRMTVHFIGVSLSGTDDILIQIGDSGGIETSGYTGTGTRLENTASVVGTASTAGMLVKASGAANLIHGHATLTLADAATFQWTMSATAANAANVGVLVSASVKALSAELDRVRVTVTGSNTFDAGSLNITYER